MNRFVLEGLVGEARTGKRVLVVSSSSTAALDTFELFAQRCAQADVPVQRIVRSRGAAAIELSEESGLILCTCPRSLPRRLTGYPMHLAYLDGFTTPTDLDEQWRVADELNARGMEVVHP